MKKESPDVEPELFDTDMVFIQTRERPIIHADCMLFACRKCLTKTGWPHKNRCELALVTGPGCGDCRYWSAKKGKCDHPKTRSDGERR